MLRRSSRGKFSDSSCETRFSRPIQVDAISSAYRTSGQAIGRVSHSAVSCAGLPQYCMKISGNIGRYFSSGLNARSFPLMRGVDIRDGEPGENSSSQPHASGLFSRERGNSLLADTKAALACSASLTICSQTTFPPPSSGNRLLPACVSR